MPFWHLSISSNFFFFFWPELVFGRRLDLCSFRRREVFSDYSSTLVDAEAAAVTADSAVTVWWIVRGVSFLFSTSLIFQRNRVWALNAFSIWISGKFDSVKARARAKFPTGRPTTMALSRFRVWGVPRRKMISSHAAVSRSRNNPNRLWLAVIFMHVKARKKTTNEQSQHSKWP